MKFNTFAMHDINCSKCLLTLTTDYSCGPFYTKAAAVKYAKALGWVGVEGVNSCPICLGKYTHSQFRFDRDRLIEQGLIKLGPKELDAKYIDIKDIK